MLTNVVRGKGVNFCLSELSLQGQRFRGNPMLCAIQVYEKIVPASLAALTARFDWSALRIYDFNAERFEPWPAAWHPRLASSPGVEPNEILIRRRHLLIQY